MKAAGKYSPLTKFTPLVALLTAMLCMSARAGILTNLQVNIAALHATEGVPFYNVTVATFTDPGESFPNFVAGPVYDPRNYSATITWGDGTGPYAATLVPGLLGIDVIGTHTFTQHGQYPVLVQVTDLVDGSAGANELPVTVRDAPLHPHGGVVTAIEATEFENVIVTFTDENPYGRLEDFTATIYWDKTCVMGRVVTNEAGGFAVVGTHTFARQATYNYRVLIADVGGTKTWGIGTVNVSDAPLIATGVDINPVEGSQFDGIVATFTHADITALPGDFTAVISWGDDPGALPLAGEVIAYGPPGSFAVRGVHTYMNEGSYILGADITSSGGSAVHPGATATIGDALLTARGVDVAATEGFLLVDMVVATFTDANTTTTTANYSAMIDWGDGTDPSSGTISGNGADGFTVSGTHLYVDEGTFRIGVVISDIGGAGAAAGATATISDAQLFVNALPFSKVEGAQFTNVVATFTDANPLSDPAELTAVIDWGDGSTSSGLITPIIVQNATVVGQSYNVVGSHTYTRWDSYGFSVTVSDSGGYVASAGTTANITDAPLTSVARVITPTENTSFMAVIANFTDANPYGTSNQFTASLDWGDGTTTSGTIIANTAVNTGSAEFVVLGSHQYANQGLYPIGVTIQSDGGSQSAASSAAVTADAPMIGTGKTFSAVKGVAFTNIVANCVDTDVTPEPETTYTCLINWGDGSTSLGTMIEGDEGTYDVSGSHTYAQAGSYVVLATIDNTQTFVSTTARSTAVVSETPAADLTSQFVIKATRPVLNKRTGLYRQTLTIKNTGRQAVTGPVSIVLDNLSNGGGSVSLYNKDGETLTPGAAPVGSPYKNLVLPKSNLFPGRTVRSVILYFRSSSPVITYNPRVLAGPGAR